MVFVFISGLISSSISVFQHLLCIHTHPHPHPLVYPPHPSYGIPTPTLWYTNPLVYRSPGHTHPFPFYIPTHPPQGMWNQVYPSPQKEHGTRYTTPCEETPASENITFPQLRWWAVITETSAQSKFCAMGNTPENIKVNETEKD